MNAGDVIQHLYLPLLTQETAVMVSTFTYGVRAGAPVPLLVAVNTAAVTTDLGLFFLPTYFLSGHLHALLVSRFQERYDQGRGIVSRFGAFRTATVMGFVMPSVAAMIVVALLRLSFWRGLIGLFVGSTLYVALPLLIALPLAPALPRSVIPVLPWVAPSLVVVFVLFTIIRRTIDKRADVTHSADV